MFLTAPILVYLLVKNKRIGFFAIAVLFIGTSAWKTTLWATNSFTWTFPLVGTMGEDDFAVTYDKP